MIHRGFVDAKAPPKVLMGQKGATVANSHEVTDVDVDGSVSDPEFVELVHCSGTPGDWEPFFCFGFGNRDGFQCGLRLIGAIGGVAGKLQGVAVLSKKDPAGV